MYAVIEGSQPLGDDDSLFTLTKAVYPTITPGNNTWTVVSTIPAKSAWNDHDVFDDIRFATCSADKTGAFTLLLMNGSLKRYDPMAPRHHNHKRVAQTAAVSGNGSKRV